MKYKLTDVILRVLLDRLKNQLEFVSCISYASVPLRYIWVVFTPRPFTFRVDTGSPLLHDIDRSIRIDGGRTRKIPFISLLPITLIFDLTTFHSFTCERELSELHLNDLRFSWRRKFIVFEPPFYCDMTFLANLVFLTPAVSVFLD